MARQPRFRAAGSRALTKLVIMREWAAVPPVIIMGTPSISSHLSLLGTVSQKARNASTVMGSFRRMALSNMRFLGTFTTE